MSNSRISNFVQLAIAAVRAAYGDFSGAAVQGIKNLPKIIALIAAAVIIAVILPAIFIQSLFTGDSI